MSHLISVKDRKNTVIIDLENMSRIKIDGNGKMFSFYPVGSSPFPLEAHNSEEFENILSKITKYFENVQEDYNEY